MKTAIITGADGDMGQQHVLTLAKEKYNIVMACHHPENGNIVCQQLRQQSQWEHIQILPLDLSSFESVQQFCNSIKQQFLHIDILLNNAGTLPSKPLSSANGYEKTIAVNYLGHFLLTELLFPLFGENTKIVSMVSLTYKYGVIHEDFFHLNAHKKYNRFFYYSNSKMALFYATLYWAEKWKDKGIIVNCADPGIVSTHIIRMDNKVIDTLCDIFFRPLIRTPKQGADTMSYVAMNENEHTGCLFRSRKIQKAKKYVLENPKRQWLLEQTKTILKEYL